MNKMPKPKPCPECQNTFIKSRIGQKVCSPQCAISFGKKEAFKSTKKEWNIEKAKTKEKLKSKSDWENDLQGEVNKICLLIDKGHNCVSCGGKNSPQAGHFFTKKAFPSIRFNLLNLFRQDYYCNVHLSSNRGGYENGIIDTFGEDLIHEIKYGLISKYPSLHLSIPDIQDKIKTARQIVKRLKSEDKTYTVDERISMRRSINQELGIYQ